MFLDYSGAHQPLRSVNKSILDGKYSVKALTNFKLFKKEVVSLDVNEDQVSDLQKVDIGWISAIIGHPEDYIKAVVLSVPGWIISDGYAVRTNQFVMGMN